MDQRNDAVLSFRQRIMVQHASPVKLTVDLAGVVAGGYLLWMHHLIPALVCLLGLSILGSLVVWRLNVGALAKTRLGAWMLVQADPANLIIRTVGFVAFLVAIWKHSLWLAVVGLSVIVAARVVGRRLNSR